MEMEKVKNSAPYLFFAISLLGYFGFSYYFKRSYQLELLGTYFVLFLSAWFLFRLSIQQSKSWVFLFVCGLLFRLLFLFPQPHLSDDYFRFTWDGELSKDGISPFTFQPRLYEQNLRDRPELMPKYKSLLEAHSEDFPEGMNSKQYFSIYPTWNQALFYLSTWTNSPNKGNLVFMRILIILAEIVTFFILRRLLQAHNQSQKWVFYYWLNPLIIIELAGNLHFDVFAISFVLMAFWFVLNRRILPAAASVSLAIVSKLNPIIFLGAVFSELKWSKFLKLVFSTLILTFGLFLVLFSKDTFLNFMKSFGLYFAWFEFNTGVYSILRDFVKMISGVDISSYLSLYFPFLTMGLFTLICLFSPKTSSIEKLLLLYFVYFSFSPIVHPWYITIILPLGILSGKLYPILWTFLIFFTYSAYSEKPFMSVQWLVYLEYALLYLCYFLETKTHYLDAVKRRVFIA